MIKIDISDLVQAVAVMYVTLSIAISISAAVIAVAIKDAATAISRAIMDSQTNEIMVHFEDDEQLFDECN